MSSTAFNANRDPMSTLLLSQQASLFFPRPWKTISNHYWDVIGYAPQIAQSWGGMTTFTTDNNICNYFAKCFLKFNVAALNAPEAAAFPTARYDDFLAYAAWDNAAMRYGSTLVDVLDGEHTKFKHYDDMMQLHKRQALQPYIQGPLSIAERRANLVNGCTCIVELPFYFTRAYSAAMPLVMGSQLQFQVQWRPFSQVIDSDIGDNGTILTAPAITDQVLILQQVYVGSAEANELWNHSQDSIVKLIDFQARTTFNDSQAQAPNTTLAKLIPTPNVNLPTAYQLIVVRLASQLATPFKYKRWLQRGLPGDPNVEVGTVSWKTTGGDIRSGTIGRALIKPFMASVYRENPGLSDGVIPMDMAHAPHQAGVSSGSLHTGTLGGYQVSVPITTKATSEVVQIDIYSTVKCAVRFQLGNQVRIFQ